MKPRTYLRKPETVLAMRITQDNREAIAEWLDGELADDVMRPGPGRGMHPELVITSATGNVSMPYGDFLILLPDGMFSTSGAELFEKEYEEQDGHVPD